MATATVPVTFKAVPDTFPVTLPVKSPSNLPAESRNTIVLAVLTEVAVVAELATLPVAVISFNLSFEILPANFSLVTATSSIFAVVTAKSLICNVSTAASAILSVVTELLSNFAVVTAKSLIFDVSTALSAILAVTTAPSVNLGAAALFEPAKSPPN